MADPVANPPGVGLDAQVSAADIDRWLSSRFVSDVGARADIYAELDRMTDAGKGLVMVSSDLRELMAMCDRIGVMSGGRLVEIFERGQWTEQRLLTAAFSELANGPEADAAALG